MRKSIFDIIADSENMENDTQRIVAMAKYEKTLVLDGGSYHSIFKFVNDYCFRDWEHRGHCTSVEDFLESLSFDDLKDCAAYHIEDHLTLIELIYNFWWLTSEKFDDQTFSKRLKWCGNYYHLKDVMDDILEQYNHTVYTNEDRNIIMVVENKAEVTAAAEIMPTDSLAFDIIKYNHRSLKGELNAKKSILISLGAELEPNRAELDKLNKQLCSDIFFMLNNMNIRHNNCNEADASKYQKFVAEMDITQLEEWYDELYQMILLAFLLLDNTERTAKVKSLKSDIINEKSSK